jgi:hypothetical protein
MLTYNCVVCDKPIKNTTRMTCDKKACRIKYRTYQKVIRATRNKYKLIYAINFGKKESR